MLVFYLLSPRLLDDDSMISVHGTVGPNINFREQAASLS